MPVFLIERRYADELELTAEDADGVNRINAGESFYWAPGHAPEALEDCEYVDVPPSDELEAVVRQLQAG